MRNIIQSNNSSGVRGVYHEVCTSRIKKPSGNIYVKHVSCWVAYTPKAKQKKTRFSVGIGEDLAFKSAVKIRDKYEKSTIMENIND